MKVWTILMTALFVVAAQCAATAEARDQFNQKETVTVDPQKSYIFFRSHEKIELQFLREVDPEEHAAWVAAREAGLARAQQHYERQAAEYRRAVETCRNVPPPCLNMQRPVPVTNENFAFSPAEADNFVSVTRGPQFTRAEDDYTFLVAVPPGTYALYGPVTIAGNGAVGYCLCMGSVRFEARAGQIIDLGEIRYPGNDGLRARGGLAVSGHVSSVEVVPYAASMARPDRLNGLPVVPAEWRAANKMPNYFGVLIDRHPALAGVLRYERDRVIDDRTGADPVPLAPQDAR